MTSSIDFDGINAAALRSARSLLPVLIPGGKFRSLEYVVRNPRQSRSASGLVLRGLPKLGVWKDFASEDGGGDIISLVAYVRGNSQADAARELADKLRVSPLRVDHGSNGHNGEHRPAAVATSGNAKSAPKIFTWGDTGPPTRKDEIRRHVYSIGARAIASRSNVTAVAM